MVYKIVNLVELDTSVKERTIFRVAIIALRENKKIRLIIKYIISGVSNTNLKFGKT